MWSLNSGKPAATTVKATFVYVLLAVLLLVTCMETKASEESASRRKNIFDKKLYQAISEEYTNGKLTNLILSPVSVEILLAVAGLGARGNTKKEISTAIGLPLELSTLGNRFYPIIFGIKGNEGFVLRVTSQIFVEKKFPLEEDFVKASAEGFDCGTQLVDFYSNPYTAVKTINTWVEDKTKGLIKNLVDSSVINQNTKVALVNAVYFKGKWTNPFDPSITSKRKFHLANGNNVDVDIMYGKMRTKYGYSEELKANILELPYVGGQVSMVILLPGKTSSIAELESKISTDEFDLNDLLFNNTQLGVVHVLFPKFKLELKMNLESSLEKLGISDMFTSQADFSGMSASNQGLKVSRVIQKAYIEVSEEGTEAAAATGFVTRESGNPRFNANRPFIFVLRHIDSGTSLFIGRVADPETFK